MIRIALPRLLRVASFRFAAFYVAVFAGSALVLGVAVFFEARSALQQQMTARIETEVAFLGVEFQSGGLAHLIDIVRKRGQGASALDYLVQDQAGAHLAGEVPATPGLTPGWTRIEVPQASEDGGRPERVRALVSDLGDGVLLAVGGDLQQIDNLEKAIATAFLWTIGLAAMLGIVGGVLLSRAFLRRVDAISRTAEAIIDGDLTRRVPTRGTGDDLDRLAGTLNHMLDRIGILMESLRQVSSDVAHDLRTPLTRLYQRLEDARAHAQSTADYESAIDAATGEAQRLLDIFSALLRIAQVEGSSPRSGVGDVDLTAVAETVADAYRPDAEEAGHTLTTTISPGVVVSGDKELLTQALANLVENSLRHTPPGTRIDVRLEGSPETGARLSVEDDGPGVAESDLPHLTDRFYRGESSRTTPGNGLGLSLVSAVAELHGATLELNAMKPGLRVMLVFPIMRDGRLIHGIGGAAISHRHAFRRRLRSVTPTIAKPSSPESIPSTISDHMSRPRQEETSRLLLYDRRIGTWRRSVLRWKPLILFVALISAGVGAFWLGVAHDNSALAASAAAPATAPVVPVTEGQAESRDVPIWLSGIGSVQPLNAVTVKVRVDGQLDRVAFTEGQDVRKGDVLAQIDPRSFRAQLKQAQANKAKDEAQLANARLDLERSMRLEAKGVATKQTLDTQRAQVAALEATLEADQAAIDMAQLQVEFSTITAPLSGRTGLRLVDPGTVVHASDANGLVTITQMQPIAVLFTVSQDELPEVLTAMAAGDPVVVAYTRGGERPLATGKLIFVDSQVDQGTGHVKLKALFDNTDRALWPGEFVDARVQVATASAATVVPAKAVERGQNGNYVYRIKPDDTVEVCPVTVRHVDEGVAVIADGVAAGDRIVVDGQYRLQPGARVEPRKATGASGS